MTEDCLFAIAFLSSEIPPLTVLRLEGQEAMNDLFTFEVVVCAVDVDPAAVEARLLGARALMSIAVPGGPPRTIAGLVTDAAILGRTEGERQSFRLRVTPLAWLLTRRRNSRIFQDKTAPEIASIVLGEHGVPHRMTLVERYPVREYCVQYEENDWEFVTRLLAEEALFFWFEPPADESGSEVLTVADSVVAYAPIAGLLVSATATTTAARWTSRRTWSPSFARGPGSRRRLSRSETTTSRGPASICPRAASRPWWPRRVLEASPSNTTSTTATTKRRTWIRGTFARAWSSSGRAPAPATAAFAAGVSRRATRSIWSITTWPRSIERTSSPAASHAGLRARRGGRPAALHEPLRPGHRRHPVPPPRPPRRVRQALESAVVVGARRARDPLRRARPRESPVPLGSRRQTERPQQLFPPRRDGVGRCRLRSAARTEDGHGGACQLPGGRPRSPDRDRLRPQRAQPAAACPPAEQDPQRHPHALDPRRRRRERARLRRPGRRRASLREGPAEPGSGGGARSDGEGRPACGPDDRTRPPRHRSGHRRDNTGGDHQHHGDRRPCGLCRWA